MADEFEQYRVDANIQDDDEFEQYKVGIENNIPPQEQNSWLERQAAGAQKYINEPLEALGRTLAHTAGGLGQGLINVAPGLYNLGASGINALGGNLPKAPMLDAVPGTGGKELGEVMSFFAGPGLVRGAAAIPKVADGLNAIQRIPAIAKAVQASANLVKANPLVASMAGNAILGGAYAPDNQLQGMALGAGGALAGNLIGKGLDALSPNRLFRGNLSRDELLNNLGITQGTETGLGDVIGSPMLKRLNENILAKIPFSGVNESMQRNAQKIIDKGHSLVNSLADNKTISNLDNYLNNTLKESYLSHHTLKNAHYKNVNKIANDINLNLELPNFQKEIAKQKDLINDTAILKYQPDMQNLIRKLGRLEVPEKDTASMIVDKFGKPFTKETKTTLEEANLLKGKLNQIAQHHMASPNPSDRYLAGIFNNLANNLKTDINTSIKESNHVPLKEAYEKAEKNYAENFSPFLDKQIYKFLNGKADPETLVSTFIKTGKATDRAELIKKLTSKLPAENKNLLGYAYLQRAMDENNVINPLKLKTLLSKNSLGEKQFAALFPDSKIRNQLRNYVKLVDMNTKALKVMQNPETGQMAMDLLPLVSSSTGKLAAKMIGGSLLGKQLRSEGVRNKLVQKMLTVNPK